ncbi:MAG: aspartate aminotransferase family protein [Candidatus Scalindua sp.]|nr:aspartate aminotransferase family protein [Candidatus Scalindua sp.]
MTKSETIELYTNYVIPNYTRNPIVFVRGEGVYVWDENGKRYLDLFSGWAVSSLGHCNPNVTKAIQEQAAMLVHMPNIYYTKPQGLLAKYISENSFHGQCFFCNSGAEANESAIKLARLHNSHRGKYKIITMDDSFHGRTLATITATAQPKYQKGLAPLIEGFTYVPFNSLPEVEKAIDDKTCGIMIEPIQGEGGINVADKEFMKQLRRICDERELLLILDEVQSGMGRTGKYFAYQHYDICPDIMTLAKSLGNGTAIGAMEAKTEVARSLVPGSHASTFGGNPLACAASVAVFETIQSEGLLKNAANMGKYAYERLSHFAQELPCIREVRGVGLMIGIELTTPATEAVQKCMEAGLLLNCTHENVIRFMPPLNVEKEHIDKGLSILQGVLKAVT